MDREELIGAFFDEYGVDSECLSSKEKDFLYVIAEEALKRFIFEKECKRDLVKKRISVKSMADSGIVSNRTIYNHKWLKDFIDFCSKIYTDELPHHLEYEKNLKRKVKEQERLIKGLNSNMLDSLILSHQLDEKERTIRELREVKDGLCKENIRLKNELNSLKFSQSANVTMLHNDE